MIEQQFPKRFRLICGLATFLIGITLGSCVIISSLDYLLYGAIASVGIIFLVRTYWFGIVYLCLASLLFGTWLATMQNARLTLTQPINYEGRVEVVSVRSIKAPQQRIILKLLDGEKRGTYIRLLDYDWGYETGSQLRISGLIEPSQYKGDLGYNLIGNIKSIKVIEQIPSSSIRADLIELINIRVGSTLPEPYASLAIGLLTGVNENFDLDFKQDLQRTGTTHIVAVSGYNLTIVALLLRRIGQRKSRMFGFCLALGAIVGYVFLAGATPSILRGATIAILALWAIMAGRITHRLPLLLLSASILSLITPLGMVYNLSWQLSFLAFAGILFFRPVVCPILNSRIGEIGNLLGETLSAEIMVLPLILFKFGLLSVVSPLVNTIVLGIVPLAMAVSFVHTLLALMSVELGRIFAWISFPILLSVIKPIEWGSSLPFATLEISRYPIPYFVISYGAVLALFYWLKRNNYGQITSN